jgi:hypothetical protein
MTPAERERLRFLISIIVAVAIVGAIIAGVIALGVWVDSAHWVCTTHVTPIGTSGQTDVTNDCAWVR